MPPANPSVPHSGTAMTQPPPGAVAPASATATTTSATGGPATFGTGGGALNPRLFGKIILTLENCLLTEAQLTETPSRQDGLDRATEIDLRILGCELIQTAGILLKLPQVAMATGQVLFQRFFYSKSFVRHAMETTAMSCVCLASKIEEAPRRIRDVINVFHHIKQVRAQKPIVPMLLDGAYISHKTQVIKAERRVLKELGFCVHVKHPHKLIVMYLQVLGYEKNQRLMQSAWNYMNDSLRTDVFMRHTPETIACACIYLTARRLALPLPNSPPWYGVLRVSEDDIIDVAYRITELYRRAKPNVEQLEQAVDALCKRHADARQKNRPGGLGTPPTTVATTTTVPNVTVVTATLPPVQTVTMADRNNGSHNAWGGFISRALPLVQTTVPPVSSVAPVALATSSVGVIGGAVVVNQMVNVGAAQLATANTVSNVSHADTNTNDSVVTTTRKRSLSPRSRSRSPQQQHHHQQQQQLLPQHQQQQMQRSPGGPGGNSNSRDDSVERQHGSRPRKKSRHRSPAGGRSDGKYEKKKSSRNYSRSPSSSPGGGHGRHKKRDRKSPARSNDKSSGDYYSNGSGDRDRSRDHRDSGGSRSTKDRNSGSRGGGGGGGGDRDRDRDRSKNDRYGGGGGGRSGGGTTSSGNNSRSSGKHRERSRDRSPDRSRDRKR